GFELGRERAARTRLLLPHALHHGHPLGGEPLISDVRQTGSSPAAIQNDKVVYTPRAGFSGCDTFTYTTTNNRGQQVTASVSVAIAAK
ncbi:Ig-like domain-containing protein, partial [Streptosporangium longisporum]